LVKYWLFLGKDGKGFKRAFGVTILYFYHPQRGIGIRWYKPFDNIIGKILGAFSGGWYGF
jgi:hypothetical protein